MTNGMATKSGHWSAFSVSSEGRLSQQHDLAGLLGLAVELRRLHFWSLGSGQQQQFLAVCGASCFSTGCCFPQHTATPAAQHHPGGKTRSRLHSNPKDLVTTTIKAMLNAYSRKGKRKRMPGNQGVPISCRPATFPLRPSAGTEFIFFQIIALGI